MGGFRLIPSRIRQLQNRVIRRLPQSRHFCGRTSFSQCGEDVIVEYIFKLRGVECPSYLDVGAYHPFHLSNTALFYLKGSRGMNVEANPQLMGEIARHRKGDINLNCGVNVEEGRSLHLFVLDDPSLSTFSERELTALGRDRLVKTIPVETHTLEHLMERYFLSGPDFLSLDVEGLDFDIIRSLDFIRYRPKVLCVESYEYSPRGTGRYRQELIGYLTSHAYHEYANTGLNSIFVNREFWFIEP